METVYPTPVEVIRYISLAFDLQPDCKKKLDDKKGEVFLDPIEIEELKNKVLSAFEKILGEDIGQTLSNTLNRLYGGYIDLISTVDVSGLERHEVLPQIIELYFIGELYKELEHPFFEFLLRNPSVIYSDTRNSVSAALSFLDGIRNEYLNLSSKEDKDTVSSWRRSEHTPNTGTLMRVVPNELDRLILLISSALDRLRKSKLGPQFLVGLKSKVSGTRAKKIPLEKAIHNRRSFFRPLMEEYARESLIVQHGLMRTVAKEESSKDLTNDALMVLEVLYRNNEFINSPYYAHWHRGRWHVMSGDLESALQEYKKAVELGAFMLGNQFKNVLTEAKIIAACQPKPDKVFIKKVKWLELLFGFEVHSVERHSPSNQFDDSIEEWELHALRSDLKRLFPQSGMFPGYSLPNLSHRSNYIVPKDVPLDLKSPDKKIYVDQDRNKRSYQIIWFAELADVPSVKSLIEAEARIDVISDVDETALIFSLQEMNLFDLDPPYFVKKNISDELFQLVSNQKHKVETVNARTQKKRLTALSLAVKTGKLEVVRKVLSMGADVNQRSGSDSQTPLNIVLKCIGCLKSKNKMKFAAGQKDFSDAAIDSFRRETGSFFGADLDANRHAKKLYDLPMASYVEALYANLKEHSSLEELRAIARELIYAGSDNNAEHQTPLDGYTPLMLVAENDEVELFNLMCQTGGDPLKQYYNPSLRKGLNAYEIRDLWRKAAVAFSD
ncbi:hypothetical protein [Marinomonas gallaica]|uniref:ankyrin repeat domain-containing protein n=1 Tax=Marinomonas gallaica TaxID=1806667 RepID=UPI003A919807